MAHKTKCDDGYNERPLKVGVTYDLIQKLKAVDRPVRVTTNQTRGYLPIRRAPPSLGRDKMRQRHMCVNTLPGVDRNMADEVVGVVSPTPIVDGSSLKVGGQKNLPSCPPLLSYTSPPQPPPIPFPPFPTPSHPSPPLSSLPFLLHSRREAAP